MKTRDVQTINHRITRLQTLIKRLIAERKVAILNEKYQKTKFPTGEGERKDEKCQT